jgi:DNA polymerase-4
MNGLGIQTGLDLRSQTLPFLQRHFGKSGPYYYWISRGIDERPVRANRVRKSVGAENTFSADIFTFEAAWQALAPIIEKLCRHCDGAGTRGRTLTLKVKYADFQQITRSRTVETTINTRAELEQISGTLLRPVFPTSRGIRLLGVSLSSLVNDVSETDRQLRLGLEVGGSIPVHDGS